MNSIAAFRSEKFSVPERFERLEILISLERPISIVNSSFTVHLLNVNLERKGRPAKVFRTILASVDHRLTSSSIKCFIRKRKPKSDGPKCSFTDRRWTTQYSGSSSNRLGGWSSIKWCSQSWEGPESAERHEHDGLRWYGTNLWIASELRPLGPDQHAQCASNRDLCRTGSHRPVSKRFRTDESWKATPKLPEEIMWAIQNPLR